MTPNTIFECVKNDFLLYYQKLVFFTEFNLIILFHLLQHFCVFVVRLHKLVFTDSAAKTDDVGDLVLLVLQRPRDDLVRLLLVALAVKSEGVVEHNRGVLSELFPVGDCLKVLHELNHFIVILDFPERQSVAIQYIKFRPSRPYIGISIFILPSSLKS